MFHLLNQTVFQLLIKLCVSTYNQTLFQLLIKLLCFNFYSNTCVSTSNQTLMFQLQNIWTDISEPTLISLTCCVSNYSATKVQWDCFLSHGLMKVEIMALCFVICIRSPFHVSCVKRISCIYTRNTWIHRAAFFFLRCSSHPITRVMCCRVVMMEESVHRQSLSSATQILHIVHSLILYKGCTNVFSGE